MQLGDIILHMRAFGLSEEEAKVYLHLVQRGPTKAGDVATELRLRRPEAYVLLQKLMQRGLVSASLGRPARFEAAAPDQFFANAFASEEATWERMAKAQSEALPFLATMRSRAGPAGDAQTYRLLHGGLDAERELARLASGARTSLEVASSVRASPRSPVRDVWDLAVRRAHEGLAVRALLADLGEIPVRQADFPPTMTAKALRETGPVRFAIADGREALLWIHDGGSVRGGGEEAAVWSNAPTLVATLTALFESLWAGGAGAPRAAAQAHDMAPVQSRE
jgi:HTH-type transcriptional regulator, sugar sensing transcriptional regulator